MTDLTQAVVLVTGANGGLGTEFVCQALAGGATKVYAAARRPQSWPDERIVPLPLDVTDPASVEAAAQTASDATVVINNAGISSRGGYLGSSLDDVKAVFETNTFGPLRVAKAFAPVLAGNGGGAIINVASALSWLARTAAYSASKAALWSLTDALRLELTGQGTQVVGAYLGYTDTPMTAQLDVPKADPADIVAAIYAGLIAGDHEVLADQTSRQVRSALSGPLTGLYPELAAARR